MSNNLPEGWKECKLGEVAEVKGGKRLPKEVNLINMPNSHPYIRTRDINNHKIMINELLFVPENVFPLISWYTVDTNDIIISIAGTIGLCAIIPPLLDHANLTENCAKLINLKEEIINRKYLFYYLISSMGKEEIKIRIVGSTQPKLPLYNIRDIPILLPPLPEQHAIASVLSSLDDKIDLLHRQNKTLEQMAEALFRQWFVVEADDGWEEVPLSEVFDFKEGPGIRNWQYRDNGIPFINIRLISDGEINVSKANFISEAEANEKYKHFFLQRKDMVVSTSGTLGKVAIIRNYHLPLLLNTSVIRFRPKDGINYSFMYGYLKSNEFYECLIDSASGSAQLNFGPIHLKQIVMKIPPNEKLEYFRKVVDPIYEKIELNYNQIRTLEKIRDTLLPKLMSGEIRVKI